MSRYASGLVVALLLAGSGALHAQGGRLVASVVEAGTGAPIEGAEVVLPELRRSAWADANGEATLGALPAGDHRVRVRHLGHVSAELTLRVAEKPVGAMFILERRVVNLDTVRIVGRYGPVDAPLGFRQRQALGFGKFITDRDLRVEGDRDFATVMSTRLPGVMAATLVGNNPCLVRQPRVTSLLHSQDAMRGTGGDDCSAIPCAVRVFLDEVDVTDALWIVRTWDLAAVEYYTEVNAPAQYR
ncbi:MAG TPA: carboxypeptidase regulatory-like domain-containing protein, partial [Gemmatimonadaceae bacterium]